MLKGILKALGLDPNERALGRYGEIAREISSYEENIEKLSDDELFNTAVEFKQKIDDGQAS